jgi:hypothetical protein
MKYIVVRDLCDSCKGDLVRSGLCKIGEETTDGKLLEKLCPICDGMQGSNSRTTVIVELPLIVERLLVYDKLDRGTA